jgi:predicted secreted protein
LETEPYREIPALAALRFILEVIAWVAIYFAWGWIPLAFAVLALSLFSVPGDKHRVIVKVSGPIRIALEVAVAVAGVAAAHRVLAIPPAGTLLLIYAIMFAASRKRIRWLLHH